MNRFRNFLVFIFILIVGATTTVAFDPALAGGLSAGPDFLRNNDDLSRPLRIIAYGDMRFTDPAEVNATNPKVRRWLVDQVAAERPDAVVLNGDVPWHGSLGADYDVFRSETQIWRHEHLHIYPVLGNHEFSGGGSEQQSLANWWNTFPELRNRRWYSVQLGSSIYVLNLDSNLSLLPNSEQMAWVRGQIAGLPTTVRFVLFNLHHPPVVDEQAVKPGNKGNSHNGRPNEYALAEFLGQSPEKSRVRYIVVAGHIHNYERFLKDDVVYVVSGGGGARPLPIVRGPEDLYRSPEFPNYNYVRFVLDGDDLRATMVRVADPEASYPTWQETDHFNIRYAEGSRHSANVQ